MAQTICKGIPSIILSAHSPSKERDHKWVEGTSITPPRHCKRCKVYLPEEVNMTSREICLIVDGTWWHWLAHQAPNGLDGIKASLYEVARSACITLTLASEETCLAIMRNRAEFVDVPRMVEKLRKQKVALPIGK